MKIAKWGNVTRYVLLIGSIAVVITMRLMRILDIYVQACNGEILQRSTHQIHQIDQNISTNKFVSTNKTHLYPGLEIWEQRTCILEKIQAEKNVSTSSNAVTHTDNIEKTWMVSSDTNMVKGEVSGIYSIPVFGYFIEKINGYCSGIFNDYYPQPLSGLFYGMLFGVSSQLTYEFRRVAIVSGMIHVVAASGYNVAVIFQVIQIFSRVISNKIVRCILLILCIFLYSCLAQFSPSIVRAMFMGYFQAIGDVIGRKHYILWSLILSSCIMLIINPLLIFSLSFQLSVSAAFGIIEGVPLLQTIFKMEKHLLIESIMTAISANIAVMPILVLSFSEYSVISPITNIVLGWMVPYLMGSSTIFLLFHRIPVLGGAIGYILWSGGSLFTRGMELFASFPWSQVQLKDQAWSKPFLLTSWGMCMLFLYHLRRKRSKNLYYQHKNLSLK